MSDAVAINGREPANPWGSCFDSAAHLLIKNHQLLNARVCHGIGVANKPGEEGLQMAHAWIEFDVKGQPRHALDPIWMVVSHAGWYRRHLQMSRIKSYSREEFVKLWGERRYPGPWDKDVKRFTKEGKAAA